MRAASLWDDLRLEVICLSNLGIAGSPRNIFWYSLCSLSRGVEHWMSLGVFGLLDPTKLRILDGYTGSQSCRDKPVRSKGKHPRFSSKVPKLLLSG